VAIDPIPLRRDDVDPRPPTPVAGDVDRILAGLGAPPAPVMATLHERWAEVVGPETAEHCRPGRLVDGRLHVDVDAPAWASQLRWQESEALARIERVVPAAAVTALVVRVRPPS
jgi:hypothetical protein